ncbi:hypothetical protein [Gallionella capsiferriformans]|uniref:Transmembrane protein n=1 Tax=Gallionella capsiferriformans (strain ES-2) TaxID=395494 RepID=D9SDG0_GALCS|nr:hypothetical protein [Gallionella capsiferriformans]ADL56758.1 hypothetical protein Galf_2763 [Gallionella capsiferriformans ES-2]
MCYSSNGQFLTQIPTWLIVVAGWFVVHHLSQKRDQRKEARERVDQLVTAILSIEERAVRFHQSDSYQGDVARSLLFDIQRIIAKLKRHPFGSFVISPTLLKELRRAVTLKNFDASKFTRQEANSAILSNIADAVDDIEDQLEQEYERIYLSTEWFVVPSQQKNCR